MRLIEKEIENSFRILKQDVLSAEISLLPDREWIFFQGHFPGMPVLPGYAITEISVYFAQQFRGLSLRLGRVHSLRMRSPIFPGLQMELFLNKNADENRFQIFWKTAAADKTALASIDFELLAHPELKDL